MTMCIGSGPELGFEVATLKSVLDRGEEACCVSAIDDAVVVRQRKEHHLANSYALADLRIGDDDRTLDDRAGPEDRDLRLIDDRRVEQCATAAGVRQRERPAGTPGRKALVGTRQ